MFTAESKMSSGIRAVLTSLEIQGVAVFASDLDDLLENLCMSGSCFWFLLEPSHRSHHDRHDSDQHFEERDSDGEEIRRIKYDDQNREDEKKDSRVPPHLGA
jgi:hypothetical protein